MSCYRQTFTAENVNRKNIYSVEETESMQLTHLLFKLLTDQDVTGSYGLHLVKDVKFARAELGHLVDGATLHDVQHVPKHIH